MLTIFADGGALGNGSATVHCYASIHIRYQDKPAPIGSGVWMELAPKISVVDSKMTLTANSGTIRVDFPSLTTNNQAEYAALLTALRYLEVMGRINQRSIPAEIRMDSQLVVNQVVGGWRIKEPTLQKLNETAKQFLAAHPEISLVKAPRDEIASVLGH